MDTGFTFLLHVKKQGTKARNLFGKIGRLFKVSYGATTVNLNFLYRTVYISITAYASNVWIQKVDNWAIQKTIKETQRQVIISTTGAYRTSPLQALCVISNNPPINYKLIEIKELGDRAKGRLNGNKTQIGQRTLARWQ